LASCRAGVAFGMRYTITPDPGMWRPKMGATAPHRLDQFFRFLQALRAQVDFRVPAISESPSKPPGDEEVARRSEVGSAPFMSAARAAGDR